MKILKRFLHNKLGWAYPKKVEDINDVFQTIHKCKCGVECTQDSTGAWFHLSELKEIKKECKELQEIIDNL